MKYNRFIAFLLFACICITVLCSCGKKDTLSLNSTLFTELEAQEVDIEWLDNYWHNDGTGYSGTQFKIVERDGNIFLEETEYHKAYYYVKTFSCVVGYKYLVAVDYYKGDYWIAAYDNGTSYIEGATSERLLEMRCTGILPGQKYTSYDDVNYKWYRDYDVAYLFVREHEYKDLPTLEDYDKGYIYRYRMINEDEYKLEKFAELDYVGTAFMMDEDDIIVATEGGLYSVDPTGEVTQLFTSEYWCHLGFSSIVKIDNAYYLGTHAGILKYDLDTKQDVWYPYYNIEE
ncbi:MAG: hypothetical protein IKM32_05485 [Clostridia bacterium]|nr:hypothetical protein [Clostridia bacterium]MBR6784130.1 hypothetical protein [Clostridia bacterium]